MNAVLLLVAFGVVGAQTTPDQAEGRPKYQRALTDLVPANFITVLDKYHRPITNNYIPEPTKQKLTKQEILARFTSKQTTPTSSTTTTTTTTTTRRPSSFVTSYPSVPSSPTAVTELPFRILFLQTTAAPSLQDAAADLPFFTRVVTQTAKTVTVIEDGKEKTEVVVQTEPPLPTTSIPSDFSPVFIYKNQRFTSEPPKSANAVTNDTTNQKQTPKTQLEARKTSEKVTPRPRRKVIKVKSRKIIRQDGQAKTAAATADKTTNEKTIETQKKAENKATKPIIQRERPKVLITRKLRDPAAQQSIVPTTVSPEISDTTPLLKTRRPLRRLNVSSTASTTKSAEFSVLQPTTPSPTRSLFRSTKIFSTPTTTGAPTSRPLISNSTPALQDITRATDRRVVSQNTTTGVRAASTTSTKTRRPEIPTTTLSEAKTATRPNKRIVTKIGTGRTATTLSATTPLPETPTYSSIVVVSDSGKATSKPRKSGKKKRKPTTQPPELPTPPKTTVTPVSIIYFQTTGYTAQTTAAPTESRRVPKRRRKKPTTPAGVVSTQTIPFAPTEPSTFNAPLAVTGFRPLSTSNYFLAPNQLDNLPKTDEISQVINLPGGRLSSYQARYSPPAHQTITQPQYSTFSSPVPPSQNPRSFRGPYSQQPSDYYSNDPTYQELQRLLASESSRFHNQPRSRFAGGYPSSIDFRS